jgi:hypothetical protein
MKRLILFSMMCLVAIASTAQDISGRVIDEQAQPMPFVNVVLVSRADSAFVAGAVTKDDGTFSIATERNDGLLKVSSVGYIIRYIDARQGNVGNIQMQPDTQMLGEVVVKGQVPKVKMRGSALVMNVDNTVLSRMGTATDVLSQVPTVVRKNNAFEIIGKGSPLIYINGRQVRDLQELQNLQSDQIKTVEVIQNPGARYDATVKSVIVIRTKRPQGEGFSVEANSWTRKNKGFSNNERLNLTYRKNGLELFANLFGAYDETNEHNWYDETINVDTLWDIHHEERLKGRGNFFEGKVGFNYQTGNHSFGAFYQNNRKYGKDFTDTEDLLLANGVNYDRLQSSKLDKEKTWPNHLVNLYYNGMVGKWMLDFNTDFIARNQELTSVNSELSDTYTNRDVNTLNKTRTRMVAEKFIAGRELWKGDLFFGEEYTTTHRTNDFTNPEAVLPSSSNEQREYSFAPLMETTQHFGKWELTAGLRYEYVSSNYYLNGQKQDEQSRTYSNLFPSFDASTQWKDWRFSFSYSGKTQRPSYAQLNGNIIYENRLNYGAGNPYLKPSKIHSINSMLMWKWVYLSANFDHIIDDIQYFVENYKQDEKIQFVTYRNYDHRDQLSLTLGGQRNFGLWSPNWNVTMVKQWFKAEHNGKEQTYNHPMLFLQMNNAFSLPHKWLARIDYSLQSTGNSGLFYNTKTNQRLNLNISRDFFRDRLNVRLEANDIFGTDKNHFTLDSNRFSIRKYENSYTRSLVLSLRYRFNTTNSKYKGTGAGNDEKNRL